MRWCFLCGVWLACFATMSSAYGQGFLLPSVASGRMKHRPFVLQRHSVDVVVRGRMAHTTITQVYSNPASVAQQAQYLFSFPKGAVVSRFSLVINGKAQVARLMGRAKANRIYLSIVRRLKDPGILEQMGGGLYRLRVFPIPAGGSRRLRISFVHMLPLFGRVIRYHYPLRLLRRQVAVARFVKLRIRWRAKRPLLRLYSPTHATTIRRINRRQIEATLYKENLSFARDLLLYASVSGNKLGVSLLAHRAPAAFQKKRTRHKGHFMLSIHPNLLHRTQQMTGKTVTFVVDTSGSMAAENRMKWAKKALLSCLSKLHPNDSINVISFATDVESLFRKPRRATTQVRKKARFFVKHLVASGGTALAPALSKALEQPYPAHQRHLIVLLTDGEPTVGLFRKPEILRMLQKKNKRGARLFSFGIGHDINTHLLDALAQNSGGVGEYVAPNREIVQRISWFYRKVRFPVLRDVRLSVSGPVRLVDRYPKRLPDVYSGNQLLVFGRYRGHGWARVRLTGWVGKRKKRMSFRLWFPKLSQKHAFVPLIWARRKIAYLLDAIRLQGENKELRQAVVSLARKFQIVTPYTSLFVKEQVLARRVRVMERSARVSVPPHAGTKRQGARIPSGRRMQKSSSSYGSASFSFGPSARIMRSVRRMRHQIRRIFERSLKRSASISGRMSVQLTVAKNGRVTKVTIRNHGLPEESVRQFKRLFLRKRFPASSSGPVTFSLPFVFQGVGGGTRSLKQLQNQKKGKQAIRQSRELQRLKQSERVSSLVSVRLVLGRRMVRETDGWSELGLPSGLPRLRVVFGSQVYLSIIKRFPAYRPLFALGQSVAFRFHRRLVLVIGRTGIERANASMWMRLRAR